MRTFKLVLAYDGTDFSGWQVQPASPTIQGLLAAAIGRITGEKVLPQGSGRTDAGVHALAQVCSFSLSANIPPDNLVIALNDVLPKSIRIMRADEISEAFHARKSATAKTYRYRIFRGAICPPFLARYVWHYPYPLDEHAMSDAAHVFVGEHDFTSFAAVDPERGCETLTNLRKIYESRWERHEAELVYTVRGNGFLHHMVRNLVGTFMLVGKGTVGKAELQEILQARSRSRAGATAPAGGLYLVSVEY